MKPRFWSHWALRRRMGGGAAMAFWRTLLINSLERLGEVVSSMLTAVRVQVVAAAGSDEARSGSSAVRAPWRRSPRAGVSRWR